MVEPRGEDKYTYAMPRDHPLVSIYSKLPQQPILVTVKSAHCGRTEEEVEPTIVIETPDEKKVGLQVPEIYAESVVPDFKMVVIWGQVVL